MLGAPVFAGLAALRGGAGLVQVAVDRALLASALTLAPELVGHTLDPRSDRRLLADAGHADVLVIGPGMGLTPASRRRLLALLEVGKPTVLDADALTLLARERRRPALPERCVITPHPGEMQRLGARFGRPEIVTGDAARLDLARAAAQALGVTVILKGARTVVVARDGTAYIEPTADSSLAKAGTGDVLAGLTGALLHVATDAFEAAMLAVHLHARAGTLAGDALGARSVLARDVLDHLSGAIRAHPQWADARHGRS